MNPSTATFDPWTAHASVYREKVFEHAFLADLTRALLVEGRRCEVLRAEFDGSGFDVALECDGVLRHVQLKAMRADGKRADVDIHTALAAKPSGCVIWLMVDPQTFQTTAFRWFGGEPGRPLPPLGDKLVRHTKADSQGVKAERADLRKVGRGRFETLPTMEAVIERLFGNGAQRELIQLRAHLARHLQLGPGTPDWMLLAQVGVFTSLPSRLDESTMVEFTHLVDGYALAGRATPGRGQAALCESRPEVFDDETRPSAIWAAMFIEHRRLRFGDGELTADDCRWFDSAYGQLRRLLTELR